MSPTDTADTRVSKTGTLSPLAEVRSLATSGKRAEAVEMLADLVETNPTTANLSAAARLWESWEAEPLPNMRTIRMAVLGDGTLEPLGAQVRVACASAGLHPVLHVGEFGQWVQELLNPDSAVYAFAPEVIVLCLSAEALFPVAVREPFPDAEILAAEVENGVTTLLAALSTVAKRATQATVILHTFAVPDYSPLGAYDVQAESGQRSRIESLNARIANAVKKEYPYVFLFDQERIEARYGKARVRDERRWYLASIPFSDEFARALSLEYLRVLRPLKGITRKCIVLDLDNTLWGGVIGEDGVEGIKLGGTASPGNAFRDFQLALDVLRQRGILLALCSKNNPDDANAALNQHPEMRLRSNAFAAVRINWEDKAANIRDIARELNIGLDSVVFMDDNPAERAQIRARLPEVLTVELPRDPALYTQKLLSLDVFETVALTTEDRQRSLQYAGQRERREYEQQLNQMTAEETVIGTDEDGDAGQVLGYLRGLNIQVRLFAADSYTVPRIAQLTNKTNQFNLTTRRYTESEVRDMASRPDEYGVYAVNVSDRFGDSGLTGVAIVRKKGEQSELDSFLLSCRVLGRGIEQALLCYVADQVRAEGRSLMLGEFLPTAKNAPAAGFFSRMGFTRVSGSDGEPQQWKASLRENECPSSLISYPEWLEISNS